MRILTEQELAEFKKNFSQAQPFSYLEIPHLFDNVEELKQALSQLDYKEKRSDLFLFLQTNDFSSIDNDTLQELRSQLCSEEFLVLMEELTGFKLKRSVVDLHGTLYRDTHHLLCHDV